MQLNTINSEWQVVPSFWMATLVISHKPVGFADGPAFLASGHTLPRGGAPVLFLSATNLREIK